MKLDDAIKQAQKLLPHLKGMDAAAIASLLTVAKRVRRAQEPLRQLERTLCPTEELNQAPLFEGDDG